MCSGMDNTCTVNLNGNLHYSTNYFHCIIKAILIMCEQYICQSLVLRSFKAINKIFLILVRAMQVTNVFLIWILILRKLEIFFQSKISCLISCQMLQASI